MEEGPVGGVNLNEYSPEKSSKYPVGSNEKLYNKKGNKNTRGQTSDDKSKTSNSGESDKHQGRPVLE